MNHLIRKTVYASVLCLLSAASFSLFAGDVEAGKTKAGLCAGCHGLDGISMSPTIPNLAGQKQAYLLKAFQDYKSGSRKDPMMASVVGMVADEDMKNIAAYYSSLK